MGVKTGNFLGSYRIKKISMKWKVAALLIIGFVAFIAIVEIYERMTTTTVSVKYAINGRITVSYPKREYQPGGTVPLTVKATNPDAVAIKTIRLYSSIRGLENVTLFSDGAFWGVILEPGEFSSDTKECEFTLPKDMEVGGNVDINLHVKYLYASVGLYGSFTNHDGGRTLTITLNIQ